ncbi:coiled-coil domain-containing protein 50 isoform X2 [Candoia aspera]
MAKQLQEEENRKARACLQEQHKDIERQDCEIAQEIQVKLVIEAEQRRQQEEDDEDIARILQQKELREEKRRKKPPPVPLQQSASEEGCYPESRDRLCRSPREPGPDLPKPGSTDGQPQQTREPWRGPPLVSEGLDLEVWGSSSETRKTKEGRRKDREKWQERRPGRHERPPRKGPADAKEEEEEDKIEPTDRGCSCPTSSQESAQGPFPLAVDAEAPRAGRGSRDRKRPQSRERPQRMPPPLMDQEEERTHAHHSNGPRGRGERGPSPTASGRERRAERPYGKSGSPNPDRHRLPSHEDHRSPRPRSRYAEHDSEAARWRHLAREDGEREPEGAWASPTSRHREGWDGEASRPRNPGMKSRGAKEDAYARPRPAAARDPECYDAEIAWKLQEEELLASQVDKRAAQVAQDEEIARLLMAEEKKAYKKAREREKKRQDQDWRDPPESVCSRSREGYEPHRGRSEKPTRAAPPLTNKDLDHPSSLRDQHNLAHQISKSESGHKGYHYKQ